MSSGKSNFSPEVKTKRSKSCELSKNLKNSSGDIFDYRSMDKKSKSCQTSKIKGQTPKPKRAVSFNYIRHQLSSKKWVNEFIVPENFQGIFLSYRDNQNTLRYLLRLSNNTFYATLKHEIDTLKKNEDVFRSELTLHSQSIMKILKSQSSESEMLESIM